jgi:probable rRNA maturation factor
MHQIIIQRTVPKNSTPAATQLKRWARKILQEKIVDTAVEMTIRIVDRAEIIELNTRYRHKLGATNILSFSYDMSKDPKEKRSLLGDIVICADVVNQEAQQQKKVLAAHWAHMVVHGTLHLLGYDHAVAAAAEIMEKIEVSALQSLGFSNPYQPGEDG